MKQLKIRYIKWPFKRRGVTLPPIGVFIRSDNKDNQRVLNHERVHWQQYQKMGLLKFYCKYVAQWIRFGYDRMPMEIEARYEEDGYTKEHYSEVYLK